MKNITKNLIFINFIILGLVLSASPVFAQAADIYNPPPKSPPTATTLDAGDISQNSATLRGSVDPKGNNANTFFKYGTSYSNLNMTVSGPSVSEPVSVIKDISGLTAGTTYYFRFCALNNVDQGGCGATLNFTTLSDTNYSAPSVTTTLASNVGENSAKLNGNWSSDSNITTWFEYGTNYNSVANGTASNTSSVNQSFGYGLMSRSITNLNPGTTYYFRARASNTAGEDSGSILSFKTPGSLQGNEGPEVTTKSASSVTENEATLKGEIDSLDGADYWFEYGTSSGNLNKETNHSSVNSGLKSVSKTISNLTEDKTYYFRVVAENDNDISYGSVKSFKTESTVNNSSEKIVVTTLASSAVSLTTAKVNGLVADSLSDYTVSIWFEYGTTPALGNSSNIENLGTISSKSFSATLTNLQPNTIYYFRAAGNNSNGTVRGDIIALKTSSIVLPPSNPPVNPPVVPVVNNPVPPVVNNPVSSVVASKFISLKIENKFENVSAGDTIEYEVTFKNISSKNIKDAVLKVELPAKVAFQRSSKGEFAGSSLILKIDLLESGAEEKVVISGSVSRGVKAKDVLLATATVFYPNPINKVKENITAYVVNNVVEKNLLPAASIFGNGGFLPNTLVEWLLLTGSIFALIYFGRKFYTDFKAPKPQV